MIALLGKDNQTGVANTESNIYDGSFEWRIENTSAERSEERTVSAIIRL